MSSRLDALFADLYSRERSGMNLDLANMRRLLARLGNPQDAFPALQIAGTNGKGSVSVLLAAALRQTGRTVGLYTSPHLVRFGERIRVNDVMLGEEETMALFEEVEAAGHAENIRGTFFEITTAMALLQFARRKVDIAVLEVGLGGRLDATSVCNPWASAVVTIDFDHMQYLGNTLAQIAREKAAIARPSIPMVCGEVSHDARVVIGACCAEVGAPLFVYNEDFFVVPSSSGFSYRSHTRTLEGVSLGLLGPHQRHNAAIALRILESLSTHGIALQDEQIRTAFAYARWPGRLELVDNKILLDGAHNPHGVRALCKALDTIFPGRRVHLVFGASGDKDLENMLPPLLSRVSSVSFCQSTRKGACSPEDLAYLAPKTMKVSCFSTVGDAVASACSFASQDDLVVIAGSLFVVGEAREFLQLPA